MLKFFRKYNKIILVVGVVVLMVAFGLGPAIRNLMPSGRNRTLGTINGTELTAGQQRTAANEVRLLTTRTFDRRQINPIMLRMRALLGRVERDEHGLAWLLMWRGARRMGLSASPGEVDQALNQIGLGRQARIERLTDRLGANEAFLRQAIRHWLMIEQYASLVQGEAFANMSVGSASPGLRQLQLATQLVNLSQQQRQLMQQMRQGGGRANMQQAMQLRMRTMQIQGLMQGGQRLSEPLVKHYIQQQGAEVGGQLLPIPADAVLNEVEPPSEQRLQSLFSEYKDDLPGEGQPWGIGYRYPDRVKLEALVVPLDQVRDTVQVDTAEALTYYRQNQSEFIPEQQQQATQPATQPEPKPFSQVMDQVMNTLARQQAEAKAERMLESAANLLAQPLRTLPERGGYKQLRADFNPPSLEKAAARIEERFGVAPTIQRFTDQWVPLADLSNLPDLGQARLTNPPATFTEYVQSARTFDPASTNPLVPKRLQVGAPSDVLETSAARAIFRLTAAENDHPPGSLESVRNQVASDARRIAAYQQLLQMREQLLSRAASGGLNAVAGQYGTSVQTFQPTTRRLGMGAQQRVPQLPAIGRSETFIDDAFDFAQSLYQKQSNLQQLRPARRQNSVGLKDRFSLVLYRIDSYQPITRQSYQRRLGNPMLRPMVSQWALGETDAVSPLSLERIKQRVGYQAEGTAQRDRDRGTGESREQGTS